MYTSKSRVLFYQENVKFNLKHPLVLKEFIKRIFTDYDRSLENINYIFCDDSYLLTLNETYLEHDDFTDVITFNLSNTSAINAEVYISIDRVKENSKIYKASIYRELCRVCFHAALHLVGLNDKTECEKEEMKRMENHYLEIYLSKK